MSIVGGFMIDVWNVPNMTNKILPYVQKPHLAISEELEHIKLKKSL